MSDNVPLEIQQEIIKWLPLKPLLQFMSVLKAWKSLIDSSKFINDYHIIQKHPQRLLLQYDLKSEFKFIFVTDDDTFPHNTTLVHVPGCINLLTNPCVVGSSNGLLCLHGHFPKIEVDTQRVVLWNPFLRKTVDIVIPYGSEKTFECDISNNVVGFGVFLETSDVKLVIIDSSIPTHWEVSVFSLSSRSWRSVSVDPLLKLFELSWDQVSVDGFIYLLGYGDDGLDRGIRCNLISFDLKSETLGQVHLPDILLNILPLGLSKRNECLTVLENTQSGIGVWMMKDGVTKSFTKMFTIKSCRALSCMRVLQFRKNGEAIVVTTGEDMRLVPRLQVYDPCSRDFNDILCGEINVSMSSYMDTLFLLDQSDYIIH